MIRVHREVKWWVLEKKIISLKHLELIKDMYDRPVTSGGITNEFPITIDFRQGSVAQMMDEFTKLIKNEIPWCIIFTVVVVFVNETRH